MPSINAIVQLLYFILFYEQYWCLQKDGS